MAEINYCATERFSLSYDALNTMRRNDQMCDIKFVIGDKTLAAHKIILASQCDYFKDIFTGNFKDSTMLTIDDIEVSLNSLELIIEFIYTSRLKINDSNVKELLIASNFLSLDDVREKCLKFVKQKIDINNFMEFNDIGILHSICGLNDLIVKFVQNNFDRIVKLNTYLSLSFEFILELIKSDDLYADEKQVYEFTIMWLKHDIEERSKYLPELIQAIRFSLLSIDYLNNTVQEEDLITSNIKCMKYLCKAYKEKYEPTGNDEETSIHNQKHRKIPQVIQIGSWDLDCRVYTLEWIFTRNELQQNIKFKFKSSYAIIMLCNGSTILFQESYGANKWAIDLTNDEMNKLDHVCTFDLQENEKKTLNLVELDKCIYLMTERGRFICINIKERRLTELCRIKAENYKYRGLTVLNELLYLVNSHNVLQYHPKDDTWSTISRIGNGEEESTAVCSLNGFLYSIGKQSMRFNTLTNTWNAIAKPKTARLHAGAIATDGLIYVIGGKNCDSYEIYDPNDDSWTSSTYKLCSKDHTFTSATVLTQGADINPETLKKHYNNLFGCLNS